mgnify:CR=1 FL=1
MSIESAFLDSLGLRFVGGQAPSLLLSYNNNLEVGPPSLAHLTPEQYVAYSYISQELFDSYFKFAFVRNPWERAVSFYKHFNFHRIMSFNDFLQYEFPILKKERTYFVQPQVDYLFNKNGDQLVDFIGRFEQLDSDYEFVRKNVAIEIPKLSHVNRSHQKQNVYSRWNLRYIYSFLKQRPSRLRTFTPFFDSGRDYRECYSDKSRQIIESYYKDDIATFNYTF